MNNVFKWIFAIFVIASVFCGVGCKPEVEIKPTEKETGTIQGKAFYSNDNVDNHSGIQITLVSTDGLRSVAYCESRGIATNARPNSLVFLCLHLVRFLPLAQHLPSIQPF